MVEVLPHLRILRFISLPVRGFLLLHKAADYKAGVWHLVLRVHASRLLCLLRADRHNWFLCLLLVHKVDLLVSEDRLGANRTENRTCFSDLSQENCMINVEWGIIPLFVQVFRKKLLFRI